MGDRITTYRPCPKCGKETEEYVATSCLQYVWNCDHCGWKSDLDYYQVSDYQIVLCTKEQARKNGGLVVCKNCKKEVMGSYILERGCIECRPKKEWVEKNGD